MTSLNSVLLEGELVGDPTLLFTPKGTSVSTFKIKSVRYFNQEEEYHEEISHFNVVTRGHLAEVCHEYLKDGRGVRIVGRLKQEVGPAYSWGQERSYDLTEVWIAAEHVEFKPERKKAGAT